MQTLLAQVLLLVSVWLVPYRLDVCSLVTRCKSCHKEIAVVKRSVFILSISLRTLQSVCSSSFKTAVIYLLATTCLASYQDQHISNIVTIMNCRKTMHLLETLQDWFASIPYDSEKRVAETQGLCSFLCIQSTAQTAEHVL